MGARGWKRNPSAQHDPAYRALCEVLVKTREAADLTQRELADKLGKPRSYVSKTETTERRIDFVELVRWCRACGANPKSVYDSLIRAVT